MDGCGHLMGEAGSTRRPPGEQPPEHQDGEYCDERGAPCFIA
jgi:hypothetical protein